MKKILDDLTADGAIADTLLQIGKDEGRGGLGILGRELRDRTDRRKAIVANIASYMPCAWINLHNPIPLKKSDILSVYITESEGKFSLWGIRTYFYDNPDAPGESFLIIDQSECIVEIARPTDPEYSAMYLLAHAQNAMKVLPKYISHLEKNPVTHKI